MPDVRIPEFDLDAISLLLDAENWLKVRCTDVDARRYTAACALAWYCGAQVMEMARLKLADWHPNGSNAVFLAPPGGPGAGRLNGVGPRLAPLLDPVRRLVEARLADVGRSVETPLLGSGPHGADTSGQLEYLRVRMKKITGGRVTSLADLRRRFVYYLGQSGADPDIVALLASGAPWPRRQDMKPEPTLEELRAVLAAAHPAP